MLAGRQYADVLAAARRKEIRISVDLPGRFTLSTRRDLRGNLRQFACRALNITPHGVFLAARTRGPLGDRVVAHIKHFGRLVGLIAHVEREGFGIEFSTGEVDAAALAERLHWYAEFRKTNTRDQRQGDRFVPAGSTTSVLFADGSRLSCLVIDISPTGAAVSADIVPELGTPLAIGSLVGRVVRHFEEGFAVQFVEAQEPALVEQRVMAAQ